MRAIPTGADAPVRALLLGARGMLGRDLAASAPDDVALVAYGREELDVTDARALGAVLDDVLPHWVVNAAAYTAVDRAESERELAFAVNAAAVGALGRLCAGRGVRVAHFGTDYVFAGDGAHPYREDAPVAPLNAYGESKLAGERALAESGARMLVLRTQWLYGAHGRSFPRTMWERATRGLSARVVADQHGAPTFTRDLAAATWALVRQDASGTLHVTNAGSATWYDVARLVYAAAGAPDLVTPCTTADYPTPARRPAYGVLDTTRLRERWGVTMRGWEEALGEFVRELGAESGEGG
jgi:dTDP-4-dehydrorhamnose reductase